jgi:hypothetical protein
MPTIALRTFMFRKRLMFRASMVVMSFTTTSFT